MRFILVLGALLLLLAPATASAPVRIAHGHVQAGDAGLSNRLIGANGQPTSITFPAPAGGTTIFTQTLDGVGRHKLQIDFSDGPTQQYHGSCFADLDAEARCVVPEGVAWVTVTATLGADLDVTVYAEPQ